MIPLRLPLLLTAILTLQLAAEDGVPPPAADGTVTGRRLERLLADHPELKGVDQATPEGQEKFRQAQQADFAKNAGQIRQRMAEGQAAAHAKLRESFAMSAEEFAAIEPLLTRIELLKLEQRMVSPQPQMGGRGRGPGGQGGPGGGDFLKALLGDTPLDPTAKETQDAVKALGSLLEDRQANETEIAAALARVRKARGALAATVDKAAGDLRGVLTPRQEAQLVDRGILE